MESRLPGDAIIKYMFTFSPKSSGNRTPGDVAGGGMLDACYLEQVSFQNVAGEKEKSKPLK
jgi:hypothetical protein